MIKKAKTVSMNDLSIELYTGCVHIRREHESLCAFACALVKEEGGVSGNVDGVSEVVPQ